MSNKSTVRTSGMSTSGLLGVVFVTLKLCGIIHWSWWWVTAPFWGWAALLLGAGILCLVVAVVWHGVEAAFKPSRNRKRMAARKALLARRGM